MQLDRTFSDYRGQDDIKGSVKERKKEMRGEAKNNGNKMVLWRM